MKRPAFRIPLDHSGWRLVPAFRLALAGVFLLFGGPAKAAPPQAPNVLLLDADPFVTPAPQVLAGFAAPDWSSAPGLTLGGVQVTTETLGQGPGTGLGSPTRRDLGATPAGTRYVLVNQVATDIAYFNLAGPPVPPRVDTDGNGLPDAWELRYFGRQGLPPEGDEDGDGFTNLAEYRAGTDPSDPNVTPDRSGWLARWRGEGDPDDDLGGRRGLWSGAAAYGTGFLGQAFRLDGASSVAMAPDDGLRPTTALTLAAWVNLARVPSGLAPIITHPSGTRGVPAFSLAVSSQGPRLLLSSSFSTQVEGPIRSLESGTWHHLAATWDGRVIRVFMDGALAEERPSSPRDIDYARGEGVRLGNDGHTGYFEGLIDEVVLADQALSELAIQTLAGGFQGEVPPRADDVRVEIELAREPGAGGGLQVRLALPALGPAVVVEALSGFGEPWAVVPTAVRVEAGRRILELPWSVGDRSRFFRVRR